MQGWTSNERSICSIRIFDRTRIKSNRTAHSIDSSRIKQGPRIRIVSNRKAVRSIRSIRSISKSVLPLFRACCRWQGAKCAKSHCNLFLAFNQYYWTRHEDKIFPTFLGSWLTILFVDKVCVESSAHRILGDGYTCSIEQFDRIEYDLIRFDSERMKARSIRFWTNEGPFDSRRIKCLVIRKIRSMTSPANWYLWPH